LLALALHLTAAIGSRQLLWHRIAAKTVLRRARRGMGSMTPVMGPIEPWDRWNCAGERVRASSAHVHPAVLPMPRKPMLGAGALSFWGKAQPRPGSVPTWHPLAAHGLDVASVAEHLAPRYLPQLEPRLIGFLAALHDLGKFTRSFQALALAHWPAVLGTFRAPPQPARHDALGLALLLGPLASTLDRTLPGWMRGHRLPLLQAVAGHHGRPNTTLEPLSPKVFCPACRTAAVEFIAAARTTFDPPPLPRPQSEWEIRRLSWRLAGLINLADWIGSAQRWFPYAPPEEVADPTAYLARVRAQATDAVAAAGLAPAAVAPFAGLQRLFPGITRPSPLQAWAATVRIPAGPTLFVIEDLTGAGKTEAAVTLAHRLLAKGCGDGLFVALPTMATASAMFERLATSYRRLFAEEAAAPSLALAHGRAHLHEGFSSSVLEDAVESGDGAEEPAGAQCAAWLADDRRRALLAQVGVGTLDQALLAVLPVRHAPLRLAGLTRKVLVVDEAHAYDAYMRRELEALLRFQAALGGSAILLSATLPQAARRCLADAFRDGLRAPEVPLTATAYPLATVVTAETVVETPCEVRDGLARRVAVTRLPDAEAAVERIQDAKVRGAAVAWVRNTVDDAIAGAAALRAAGVEVMLFHARFAMADRLAIEQDILRRFGPRGEPADRPGVVVATQVIEQSLDLDFDLLVSDLAPADLLIQRAGRLWRHRDRSARPVPGPEMLVVSPEPVPDPPADWIRPGVYRDPALLWRSARALFGAGAIAAPGGLRSLVEAAYDRDAPDAVPSAFERRATEAHAKEMTDSAVARQNVLDFEMGYSPQAGLWESDVRTPTRLEEEETVTLRLALLRDGVVAPYAQAEDRARAWALSEVSVARRRVTACPSPPGLEAAVEAARSQWGRWEREATERLLLAVLEPEGASWRLLARTKAGVAAVAYYDRSSGLLLPR